MNKLICIVGPTASGKTKLAIDIALLIGAEIIGADSMQIYKGFDISTAKPTAAQRATVKYHLIDFLDPDSEYNVSDYVADASSIINEIYGKGLAPIICGGTGLYADSLTKGIVFCEQSDNANIRAELTEFLAQNGEDRLWSELNALDPEAAASIDKRNHRRVIRALEIIKQTGKKFSQIKALSLPSVPPYDTVYLVLSFKNRDVLYSRINDRVDEMMSEGLLSEAEHYYHNRDKLSVTALQAIGCKEFIPYFDGTSSLDNCIERLKLDTRRYAKRQITWFKKEDPAYHIYIDTFSDYNELKDHCLALLAGEGYKIG